MPSSKVCAITLENEMDKLYSFVYRGQLTEASLDKNGRMRKKHFGEIDAEALRKTLSYDFLDSDRLSEAQYMSVVYCAIHAFENMVRNLVQKALAERYKEEWWSKVPDKIQKRVAIRMEEDQKFRWHGTRGRTEVNYCDFGDLSSIIVTNWEIFEDVLVNIEWVKSTLGALEKSRNIVMHGGMLAGEDVERIGVNIRDWIRQSG